MVNRRAQTCRINRREIATEIQNIQVAEGDVCRGLTIPLHMIFPRLFTCPTLASKNFKVEFEINVVVLLQDGYLITENFPIRLVRAKPITVGFTKK